MDEKNKKTKKLDFNDLGRIAGGLSIGGRRFNSTVINEDLSKGSVDVNITLDGKKSHGHGNGHAYGLEAGNVEIVNNDSDDSITDDTESANVELFPDENLIPFDPD